MRFVFFFLPAVIACTGNDQTYSSKTDGGATAEANGLLEVYPTEIQFKPMPVSSGRMEAFRVTNTGDSMLIVTHVKITDPGDNMGVEVFSNLRRADGETSTSLNLGAGKTVEFTLNASLEMPGDAIGNIEIYTNDTSVDMGAGPGKFMLMLGASAIDPNPDTGIGDTGNGDGDTGNGDTGMGEEDE
jgi:hypothetical protein